MKHFILVVTSLFAAPGVHVRKNAGNYLHVNYGSCNQYQYYYGGPAPRRPKTRLDRIGILGALLVASLMGLVDVLWFYGKWAGFLNAPLPVGAVRQHIVETVPLFWFVLSLAYFYFCCTRRVFN